MRKLKFVTWLGATLLAACGGGNTLTGSTSTGGTGTSTLASISVTSSVASIAADGSDSATITAVAKDANNNFVQNVTISFGTSAGGLAVTQAKTDASGRAIATLTADATSPVGTAITVTAASGSISGKAVVNVVNTQQTITLTTSLPQIPSDSSKAATITALVRGSNNQFLSGVNVCFSASSGGLSGLINGCTSTDNNGAAIATLNAANDPTNRRITVTATAGTASATVPVDVTGTKLTISGPQSLIQNGPAGTYTVSLTNSGNVGIAGQAVTVASASGNAITTSPVMTDATGTGTVQMAATKAGNDTISASVLGLTATQAVSISNQSFTLSAPKANAPINLGASQIVTLVWTASGVPQAGQTVTFTSTRGTLASTTVVTDGTGTASTSISSTTAGPAVIAASGTGVSTQVAVDFVATTPASVSVQASPTTVPTQGQSTVTAVVRDAKNNLVEGQTVNFQLVDSTGGSLSVATGVTDIQGTAQTIYTAGSTSSAANGVIINASVVGTPGGTATLTVGGQTVFLSLGTGNLITSANNAQYYIDYAIQAIDAAGNGLDGKQVVLSVESLAYIKGVHFWNGTFWDTPTTPVCASEDVNHNGILDPGEDFNGNGKLDPGNVASVTPASVTTANGGTGLVKIYYPKDHAYWVKVRLTATATVAGTQSSTSADFWLPGAANDFNQQAVMPPGMSSPYGTAATCANPN